MLSFPFLVYIIVAGILLPYSQDVFRLNIPVFLVQPTYFSGIIDFILKTKYKIYWTTDFFVIMMLTVVGQLLPAIIDLRGRPRQMLRYLNLFVYLSVSVVVASAVDVLEYLFTKQARFLVTGDKGQPAREKNWPILMIEALFGIMLLYFAYATGNVWLFIIGTALILSPLVFRYDLDNLILNKFLYVPFAVNLIILILIGRSLE